MLLPATTLGVGLAVLVNTRSASPVTVVVVEAVLFAGVVSFVVLAAVTLLVITVACAVVLVTFTVMVNTAVSPLATVAFEKTMLPVAPTAGAAVPHPVPVVTTADT